MITRKTIDGLRGHIFLTIDWLFHGTGWDRIDSFCGKECPHRPFLQKYPPASGDAQSQREEK